MSIQNHQHDVIYLSDLITPNEVGTIQGICVVCGRSTLKGLKAVFSGNFTLWNILQGGTCICPPCYELTHNQKYRRSMWEASRQGILFFKKKEMLEHLLNPPAPPFAIYFTRTWQKQGYFQLINKMNYSRTNFLIAFDMQLIHIDLRLAKEMADIIKDLRERKITKTELRTGRLYASHYKDCDIHILDKIKQEFIKNPLWELIIYAVD